MQPVWRPPIEEAARPSADYGSVRLLQLTSIVPVQKYQLTVQLRFNKS